MPEPTRYVEEWRHRDPGVQVRAGITRDGDAWINDQVRLSVDDADELGRWLQEAAARARARAGAPALGHVLVRGGSATGETLAWAMRGAIRAGSYPPGMRLPSAATLRAAYGASLSQPTVDKAMRLLAARGFARHKRGVGYVVPDVLPVTLAHLGGSGEMPVARQIASHADASGDREPINPRGYRVVYKEVADRIERRIKAGEWPHDSSLPRREHLAAWYSVSCGSIRKALRLLEERGLVRVLPSRGTFVL
jgi:GntR family transcriptional regulator